MIAAQDNHLTIVQVLLDYGAEVNFQHRGTALHYAARLGHEAVARTLIEYGADTTLIDQIQTALVAAAACGHKALVKLLMANEESQGFLDEAMFEAVRHGHPDIVTMLLEKGANANYCFYGSTLMLAAINGHGDVVRVLIGYGANVNQQDEDRGFTALMYAVTNMSEYSDESKDPAKAFNVAQIN